MASNWAQPWRNVQFDATGKPPAGAGIASEILQKRSRRLAMLVAQARQIDSDGRAIDDPPVTADHHPVGLVSATQHQRGDRVAGAGKPQLVQGEAGEVGLPADLDLADIAPPEALGGSLGGPSHGNETGDLSCPVAPTPP